MDNAIVEQVFQTIGQATEWVNYIYPKKDGDQLVWAWRHNDMSNKNFPKT